MLCILEILLSLLSSLYPYPNILAVILPCFELLAFSDMPNCPQNTQMSLNGSRYYQHPGNRAVTWLYAFPSLCPASIKQLSTKITSTREKVKTHHILQ